MRERERDGKGERWKGREREREREIEKGNEGKRERWKGREREREREIEKGEGGLGNWALHMWMLRLDSEANRLGFCLLHLTCFPCKRNKRSTSDAILIQ